MTTNMAAGGTVTSQLRHEKPSIGQGFRPLTFFLFSRMETLRWPAAFSPRLFYIDKEKNGRAHGEH